MIITKSNYKKEFLFSLFVFMVAFFSAWLFAKKIKIGLNGDNYSFLHLFAHNIYISAKLLILGLLTLGIGNTVYLFYNGFFLGLTVFSVYYQFGITPILTGIVPHVIFEITGFLIFCMLGYESFFVVRDLRSSVLKENQSVNKLEIFKFVQFKKSIFLLCLAILLLAIAAFIEANFSYSLK